MAMMMPVLVSPILMVEVSTAAIIVSWCLGVRGSGWRFNWSWVGLVSVKGSCWMVFWFIWKWFMFTWRRLLMLSSIKRCGSVVSVVGCGKLYLGVVVIVYCSITKIHQYSISCW